MGEENQLRLLYHFTAPSKLERILAESELRTGPVPASGRRFRSVPDVVWLTDTGEPGSGIDHGLGTDAGGPADDKRAVRFTLSVADAQYWPEWAARRRISRRVRNQLDEAGGELSARWWVVTRPIPAHEWVRVDDLRTGERLWPYRDQDSA